MPRLPPQRQRQQQQQPQPPPDAKCTNNSSQRSEPQRSTQHILVKLLELEDCVYRQQLIIAHLTQAAGDAYLKICKS
ncbi:uncharacterized protein Dvir_GJ26023 [Drosophila virilis]|uniref:Uncharacterized protein n=1 Tax=Drosophila virilis TaxID=7244 RepID=A0A0Q9WQU8_DROVI|nr:uncharacterized protein Dvir_GJ26023 [Drosophila virilis]